MEILVVAIYFTLTGAQESQLEGPQNTLSFVGSTVTLKCSSPSRNCNGTDWQKFIPNATPITIFKGGIILNVVDRDRYSVNNSSGCALVIRNVQLTDAGRFICSAILSSSQLTKTAYLIILETQPKCILNAYENSTVDRDEVLLKCEVTYSGTNIGASMNWKGVPDAPAAVYNGNTISRSFFRVASAPEIPSFTCETSFAFETVENGIGLPIVGLATNRIPNATCSTPVTKVFYSVRNVTLSPSLSNYPHGTVITCVAMGYPPPTVKWQEMETDGHWMDIQNQYCSIFAVTSVSSNWYRCVAMNVVRDRSYNATSHEIQFNNTDNLSSTGTIRPTSENYLGIGIGLGLLIAILLAIAVVGLLIGLGYLKFQPRTSNKSSDGVVRHQDHEMSPTSHQRSAVPRTGAPLVGEQESAYARLGEDRDVNEYASLEQR